MRGKRIILLLSIFLSGLLLITHFSISSSNSFSLKSISYSEMKDKSINMINEMNLTLIGRFEEGDNLISDVVTYNQYAIVADIYDSLKVLDTTNINTPEKVFHYWTGGRWNGLEIIGNRLYAAHHGDGLQIFDITDPENPLKYGILWLNEDPPYTDPQDVAVMGNYAYLADDFKGLQVINVTDISWPKGVGRWNDGGSAKGVAVEGSYAFVIERSGELEIIDITDPLNPIEIGNYTNGGSGNNIMVKDGIAYVADLMDGLEILNVSNPHAPVLITKYNVDAGEANGLFLTNSTLFLADGLNGLEVVNISDPYEPVRLAHYSSEKYATNVYVNGTLVYLCQQEGRLDILDLYGNLSPYEEPEEPPPEIISNRIKMDPINIDSNNDFLEYNFPGSGTVEDPYILENIHIYNDRKSLITINNTNAHFIIRNCILDGIRLNFGGNGIQLDSVANGYLVNNTITRTSQGVVLVNCQNFVIAGNRISNNSHQAIILVNSINSLISDNILIAQSYEYSSSSSDYGIEIHRSNWNTFLYNKMKKFRLHAVYIGDIDQDNTFLYNTFIGNNGGKIQQISDEGSNNEYRYNHFDVWKSPDNDNDGIVDIPFPIYNNTLTDPYPMLDYPIHTLTNPNIHIDPSLEIYSEDLNISWDTVVDSYNTSILYALYISEDCVLWIPIITNCQITNIIWDSSSVSDGFYTLRVIAQCETGLISYSFKTIFVNQSGMESSPTTSVETSTTNSTSSYELINITPWYGVLTVLVICLVAFISRNDNELIR